MIQTCEKHFNGPEYDSAKDQHRLSNQHQKIKNLMLDSMFRTVKEISQITGEPETSVSAQLRHLRKRRFGAYRVLKRRRGGNGSNIWEYQVLVPLIERDASGQYKLFLIGER